VLIEVNIVSPLPLVDKELICSFLNFNYESFQRDPRIELTQYVMCNKEGLKAEGNIPHDLAVKIFSLPNLEEMT
jgi:hypothetical protein